MRGIELTLERLEPVALVDQLVRVLALLGRDEPELEARDLGWPVLVRSHVHPDESTILGRAVRVSRDFLLEI